jgi:hypothetical protein
MARWTKGGGIQAFDWNKKKNCDHKKLPFNPDVIKDVPLRQCHTIRDLANALHMSKSTLHKRLNEGKFRRHTNAIKFTLIEQNMKEHVWFCVHMLDSLSLPEDPTFKSLYNVKKTISNLGGTMWFLLRREIGTKIQSKRGLEPGWLDALPHLSPNQLN